MTPFLYGFLCGSIPFLLLLVWRQRVADARETMLTRMLIARNPGEYAALEKLMAQRSTVKEKTPPQAETPDPPELDPKVQAWLSDRAAVAGAGSAEFIYGMPPPQRMDDGLNEQP